jgi:2-keto-4-pentenoate hydratase/2-oxohepta-3-ene-1,7-dioic acid hydratase in catechol pathway
MENPVTQPLKAVVFERGGSERLGRLDGSHVIDAGPAGSHGFTPTPEGWDLIRAAKGPRHELNDVVLRAPLRPPKILAIGINYRDHATESNNDVPGEPVVFAKFPSSVIGPDETIIVPREETRPDWEGEMAVVIGSPTYRATPESAHRAIGAFTALNDVSGRRAQLETPLQQFTLGKSFDTFTPLGPCLVEPSGIDLAELHLTTDVSGERMQDASTSEMIFSAVELIEYLSRGMSLEPGDVIASGTPSGVGNRMDPPRYLSEGDIVEVTLTHVGTLRSTVTIEP